MGIGGLGHDTELTQVAVGAGEGVGHVLQGLVGGIGGGAVDGNGQGLVAQRDGQAQLLALHGVGQAGDLGIVLRAVPAVLVVPVAGGVVANVQPVVVVNVAVEDAPVGVGLQGQGDGAAALHFPISVHIEQRTVAAAVVVAAGVVGSALQGEPLSAACCADRDPAETAQDHDSRKNQAQNFPSDFLHACFLLFYFCCIRSLTYALLYLIIDIATNQSKNPFNFCCFCDNGFIGAQTGKEAPPCPEGNAFPSPGRTSLSPKITTEKISSRFHTFRQSPIIRKTHRHIILPRKAI